MTVAFESGYTLPSGDLPLNHARVLHDGNRFKVKTITASSELSLYPGTAANSGDTVDRWRPFANEITDPSDFSTANWTKDDITVATDGQTLIENSDVAQLHSLTYTPSLPTTGVEVTTSCKVSLSNERSQFRIRCSDGTSVFSCVFDLSDETTIAENATAKIRKLGGRVYECSITYTPLAVPNLNVQFWFYKNYQFFYDGDGVSGYKLLRFSHHASEATLTYDLFTAQEGDTFAIAAHNLWSSGATLKQQYLGADVTNFLTYSEQFENAAWIKARATVTANAALSPDGNLTADKIVENTETGGHNINRSQTVTIGPPYAFTIYAKAAERSFFRLESFNAENDGENAVFDLTTGTIVSQLGTSAPTITAVGNGWYRCSIIIINDTDTSSQLAISLFSDEVTSFYTGDGTSGIYIWGAQLQTGAEATTYIKTEATTVTSGWRDFETRITPTDNSPVMFIYEPITSAKWRIQVSGGALPEVGVFRVGKSLQMERPFYGGFTIPRMARNTVVRGNISGSGELLGRSKERTTLRTQYQWQLLSYDWVRANLDGPTGLIQSAESEPVFLAWRPSATQDVDYIMRASTDAPNAMGLRDLWTFGMSGEAHSYE